MSDPNPNQEALSPKERERLETCPIKEVPAAYRVSGSDARLMSHLARGTKEKHELIRVILRDRLAKEMLGRILIDDVDGTIGYRTTSPRSGLEEIPIGEPEPARAAKGGGA